MDPADSLNPNSKSAYKRSLERILSNLVHEIAMVKATSEAAVSSIQFLADERAKERAEVEDARKRVAAVERARSRLLSVAEAVLNALDGAPSIAKIARLKKRLAIAVGSQGETVSMPGNVGRARDFLKMLGRGENWRLVSFVEGGVLSEHVIWCGNKVSGHTAHPSQLARWALEYLLEETVEDLDDDE